jgi:hypothetical protein
VIDDWHKDSVVVEFICNTGGSHETRTVRTFYEPGYVLRTPEPRPGGGYTYKDALRPEEWSDALYITEIKVASPRSYRCPYDKPPYDNKNLAWLVDAGPKGSALLDRTNGWTHTWSGMGIQAQGVYTYSTEASCASSKPDGVVAPLVQYDIWCIR